MAAEDESGLWMRKEISCRQPTTLDLSYLQFLLRWYREKAVNPALLRSDELGLQPFDEMLRSTVPAFYDLTVGRMLHNMFVSAMASEYCLTKFGKKLGNIPKLVEEGTTIPPHSAGTIQGGGGGEGEGGARMPVPKPEVLAMHDVYYFPRSGQWEEGLLHVREGTMSWLHVGASGKYMLLAAATPNLSTRIMTVGRQREHEALLKKLYGLQSFAKDAGDAERCCRGLEDLYRLSCERLNYAANVPL
jgi:hypothetical protein